MSNELTNMNSDLSRQALSLRDEMKPQLLACESFCSELNIDPTKEVKQRQGISYLPISAIEATLDEMYAGLWKTEKMEWKVIVNEIVVSLELHVFHPVAKVWISRCGVGVAQIRQSKGAKIQDIESKIKNGLEMDVPHAKSDAIKNAAKSLGKIFGRDLSRKQQDVSDYAPTIISNLEDAELFLEIRENLDNCQSEEDLTCVYKEYKGRVTDEESFLSMLTAKKKQLADDNS